MFSRLVAYLQQMARRRLVNAEIEDELSFHLQQETQEQVARGLAPAEARRVALRDLGGLAQTREAMREVRVTWFDELGRDLRYAARGFVRNPGFTVAAATTLALAIGASTAMFSVVNAVLLRPLPLRSPERLALLFTGAPSPNPQGRAGYLTVEEWRRRSHSFADLAAFDGTSVTLTTADGAERVGVARITPNFFAVLGVQPAQGRMFTAQEADARQHVSLISHRFWETHFGGSTGAIGSSIVLDGLRSEIIGILPADFDVPRLNAEVWEPHTLFPDWDGRRTARGAGGWNVVARLRPGVSFDQTQAEMTAIAEALDQEWPANRTQGTSVVPLSRYLVGSRSRLALWILTGAVFCVLLIAAANVASLSLARSVARTREMAIRAALGASHARIVRQLLTESVTLAALSGLLGSGLALVGIRLIRAFGPDNLARLNEARLDLNVLGGALALSLLTGLLIGVAPAITMARRDLRSAGDEGGRSVAGGRATSRIRRALVVTEFALAIVLMAGAGLLIRSWSSVTRVDPGFRPERVLSINVQAPVAIAPAQRSGFYADVLEQVESVPGVESAAMIGDLFVTNDDQHALTTEETAGTTPAPTRIRHDEASDEIFATLGTPLLRGRFFSPRESRSGADTPVAIINETMARHLWSDADPVGRRFRIGPGSPWFIVVGVVGDMRREGVEVEPVPQMFEPLAQNASRLEILLVRTSMDEPLRLAGAVQAAVRRVDKQTPLYGVSTVDDQMARYLTQRRFQTALLVGFSVGALVMAAIGIYGLIHYSVATRSQEIGIRMAVGAAAGDIFRMVIQEGLQLSLAGLVMGLLGAFWVGRAGSSLLFGVSATDPITLTAVSLLLIIVAAAACYFPARRATKVAPVDALRSA